MMLLLLTGGVLILVALGLVLMNLHYLQVGSVTDMVNDRIRPIHYVTRTLRDNPEAFHASIVYNLVFCGLMLLVGVALVWVGIRLIRRYPTKPNGDPWWFI